MVSEKPDEQNPANPDDHDGAYLFDEAFIYAGTPNRAICTYCETVVLLGEQRTVGEARAVDHRQGYMGGPACTANSPNPDAGK